MPRWLNLIIALALVPLVILPFAIIAFLVRVTSQGPSFHWSSRVGKNNVLFDMPKFRTMRLNAPDVPTHQLRDPEMYVTPIGRILRKTSLDELPQIWSVLKGHMAFVGPRPALFNQGDLVGLRTEQGVHELTPGITGWAQINGRDEIPIPEKAALDAYYLRNRSFLFDLKIIWRTVFAITQSKGVSH